MNKEILEALKDTLKSLEKIENMFDGDDTVFEKMKDKVFKSLEEASKEPCKIHIDVKKDGNCCIASEGNRLSLLIALAGAEKNILEELKYDEKMFDFIKSIVEEKRVDKNE